MELEQCIGGNYTPSKWALVGEAMHEQIRRRKKNTRDSPDKGPTRAVVTLVENHRLQLRTASLGDEGHIQRPPERAATKSQCCPARGRLTLLQIQNQ